MSDTETESDETSSITTELPVLHSNFKPFIPQKTREYCVCKSTLTTNELTIPCQMCFCWFHGKCVKISFSSKVFICFKCKANSFNQKPIKLVPITKRILKPPSFFQPPLYSQLPIINSHSNFTSHSIQKQKPIIQMKVASMTDRWKVESRPQTPIMRKEYPINTTTQKLVKPVQKMQKMVSSVPVVHPIAIRSNKKLKQTSKTHPAPISLPKPKPASTPISLPILVSSDTEESSFIDSESGSDLDSDKESTLSPIEIINDIPRTELPVIVESLSDILDELTSESERESMDEIDVYESNDQYCSSTFSYDEEEEIERTMDRQVCIYKDWSEASEREFSDSDEEKVEAEENENKKQVLETKKMEYKSDLLSLDNSPIKLTENQVLDELLIALADSEVNIGIIPTIPFTSNDTQLDEKRNTTSNKQSCLEREDSSLAVFIKNHQFSNHQKKRTSKHQDMERVSCLVQDYLASHYQMTGHHSNHGSYEDPKKVRVVREKRIKKRIVERFDCREFLDLGSDDTDCEIKNENEENQRKRNDCTWYEEKSKFKFRRYGFQQKMPFS